MSFDELEFRLHSEIGSYIANKFPGIVIDDIRDSSLSGLGLDSLGHVELSGIVENVLGQGVEPDIAFNYPTINSLVSHALLLHSESEEAHEAG